jgi:hypothetical protein
VLADRLAERGWHVQPTYAYGRSPAHIHLTIDPTNAKRADDLARDLRAAAIDLPARVIPPEEFAALLSRVDTRTIMSELGISEGKLPARAAVIHRILDSSPPAERERLLTAFVGELFS